MLYFERLVVDVSNGRVLEGVVAEEDLWRGGQLLVSALGKDDHAWVIEVLGRAIEQVAHERAVTRVRLEGALLAGALRYTLFLDDDAGRALPDGHEELQEILSALSGLIEIR